MVDYPGFRWYWQKNDARDMIGVLSFLAGAFFFFTGLILYFVRQGFEEAGGPVPVHLDAFSPFIALGVALFIVTLATLLIPIKAPSSRP